MNRMYIVFCCFCLIGILPVARLRSIDQIIEDVEKNFEANYTGPMDRMPSRVWYDYEMSGRTEELVKLQLDLVMTKELWDTVIDTEDALPARSRRNAVKDKERLWTRRIPYVLNNGFNISDKFKLLMAMDHWEEHTCLKFVEADENKDFDIIEFVPVEFGCESLLGRMQGRQAINLAPACMYKEVIVHEIGHALGLYHEHMRADRDDYVTVHYENINETNHPQFDKLKASHYDGYNKPYDYESVMHYGKLFYSVNRKKNLITIEPKNETYLDVIGEAPSLSFLDVKIVNDMYECSAGCVPKACAGNGFLGKNCECYCQGKDAYDIVLCDKTENCGTPDINITQYSVYTNNYEHEIPSWDENVTYPHGTNFLVEHRNESCGYRRGTFNCTDGQWEGETPPCEKACVVEDFSDDYIVTFGSDLVNPGERIQSADGISVRCKMGRRGEEIQEEFIDCSDGVWNRHISDIVCIKEHPLCPMVINAQISGSFEDGFKVSCLDGYNMETAEPVNEFTCSWEGTWEPDTPVCNPANCSIAPIENETGQLLNQNGEEVFRGSEITHGSDVTLYCPKGHIPDQATVSCNLGNWNSPDGKIPECVQVTCPEPTIVGASYSPKRNVYVYGDSIRVWWCRGLLAVEGSRNLECQKSGTWSDTAVCKPFCEGGVVKFEAIKNKAFKDNVWYRKFGLPSYRSCEKKCLKYKRFLCRSFVFGTNNGRNSCGLYRWSPEEIPANVQTRTFWTIGVRKCIQN